MLDAKKYGLLFALLLLSGCSSFAKGITEAILERETPDERICEVTGPAFDGVTKSVERHVLEGKNHSTKILMVHGINRHLPGYSAQFREKLTRSLGLNAIQEDYKEIKLQHPEYRSKDGEYSDLGILRVYRHVEADEDLELLFYELTWSPITEPHKKLIAYDDSAEHTHKRALINRSLKSFMNSTVPDILIYLGTKKEHINVATAQSLCWMFTGDWDAIKDGANAFCDPSRDVRPDVIRDDDFFFVTHSLGSRITTDMAHYFSVNFIEDEYSSDLVKDFSRSVRDKDFTVFMMANQLPLLEMAHEPPLVTGQIDDYCQPGSDKYEQRVLKSMKIIAFNDPNDILSYPVPSRFANNHIDSRLCPSVVNVNLNVAHVKDAFGVAEFADPVDAHQGYQNDDRVIRIITDGINHQTMADIVQKRCQWTEILE